MRLDDDADHRPSRSNTGSRIEPLGEIRGGRL